MSDSSNSSMTHDEAFAQLGALALEALDAVEEHITMQHVANCAQCEAELAAMARVIANLPQIPQDGAMPMDRRNAIRALLMKRALL